MNGLIVDLFAGGGGASLGIEAALQRHVDIAINHDPIAIAVHGRNHPKTKHYTSNIWEVDPVEATGGKPVLFLHASPDCTHFSRAKGDVPRSQNIRSLADVVIIWAEKTRPSCITLENVPEFEQWGPLTDQGVPIRARRGETFKAFVSKLRALKYAVEWWVLDASLYGAPTKRKRLFLAARCDGNPIVKPKPTHGPGLKPLRTAAECIDWSLPCPSIFERERPLADKTLKRIAAGIRRYVIETASPFIVPVNHGGGESRANSIDAPLPTQTASRRSHALVTPVVVGLDNQTSNKAENGADESLTTITSKARHLLVSPTLAPVREPIIGSGRLSKKAIEEFFEPAFERLVAPTLVQTGYGERPGQAPRTLDIGEPLGTLVNGQKHAPVAAFLAKHFGDPSRRNGGGVVLGQKIEQSLGSVTARDHHSLVTSTLVKFRGTSDSQVASSGAPAREPMPTVTAGGIHVAEVRAFLVKYFNTAIGQSVADPLHTVTTKHRVGLVTVDGVDHVLVDIGMRMLQPDELKRAQFGRFAEHCDLSGAKTKAAQVRLLGNSVCPEVEEALVAAQLPIGPALARAA